MPDAGWPVDWNEVCHLQVRVEGVAGGMALCGQLYEVSAVERLKWLHECGVVVLHYATLRG
jgi:hypothetical protein